MSIRRETRASALGILQAGVAVLALVAVSCVGGSGERIPQTGSPPGVADGGVSPAVWGDERFQALACSLPREILVRMVNGYQPQRSGDVQLVLKEESSFARAHSAPWDYLQHVPMFLYGPGHVPAAGRVGTRATMADLAPTLAAYLSFDFDAPDGRPLMEAVRSKQGRRAPPRLILVVVWDGGGRNVLARWPESWPTLKSLIPRGTWFENATLGSSPSTTPPVHTTLGTGAYARRHGLVSLTLRVGNRMVPSHRNGPQHLLTPALADLYDRAEGNAPRVGLVAFRDWHLGMIGQGSFFEGGDRDLAVLLDRGTGRWALRGENGRYFRFPSYVNDVPGLEDATRELDLEDGALDGLWLGETPLDDPGALRRTPAHGRWQTAVLEEIIRREGFGADRVPDLLFTNYKQIDEAGHAWGLGSPQMEAVVESSDAAVRSLLLTLDREVGRGRWVLALTADHGVIPDLESTGGFYISREEFLADITAAFDDGDRVPVVKEFRPTELWVDARELRENGSSLRELAAFVAEYTRGENSTDRSGLPEEKHDERVFAAAFPSRMLGNLPCLADGGSDS